MNDEKSHNDTGKTIIGENLDTIRSVIKDKHKENEVIIEITRLITGPISYLDKLRLITNSNEINHRNK